MHLYKTLKSFLYDQDYFVDLWKNCLHVYGIVDIDTLKEQKIVLTLEKFKLEINGENFRVDLLEACIFAFNLNSGQLRYTSVLAE